MWSASERGDSVVQALHATDRSVSHEEDRGVMHKHRYSLFASYGSDVVVPTIAALLCRAIAHERGHSVPFRTPHKVRIGCHGLHDTGQSLIFLSAANPRHKFQIFSKQMTWAMHAHHFVAKTTNDIHNNNFPTKVSDLIVYF